MAETTKPDLVIVGAGALGMALALHARRLGAHVVLADRGVAEPGDQPQAALRQAALAVSASIAQAQRRGAGFGFADEAPKIVPKAVQERAAQIAASRAAEDSPDHMRAQGVDLVSGPVEFVDQRTLAIGGVQMRPRHVLIAMGGAPVVPDLPGLSEIGFFTVDSLAANTRKLTHLVVIGGGAEALEQAQIQRRLGAAVTVVPQGPVLPGYDAEAASLLLRALSEEGIRIMTGANVRSIVPRAMGTGVITEHADGTQEALDVSHVLVAMGRRADLETLRIDRLKQRPASGQNGNFVTGALGRTSNRLLRLTGPAAGLEQWHHMLAHGRSVVEALVLGAPQRRLPAQPLLVQTAPGLAQIGLLPGNGEKARAGTGVLRANMVENDKARALGVEMGVAKIVVDARGRVLGGSIVGPDAGELAAVLALAMERGLPAGALADLSMPHPSLFGVLAALGERQRAGEKPGWATPMLRAIRRLLPR